MLDFKRVEVSDLLKIEDLPNEWESGLMSYPQCPLCSQVHDKSLWRGDGWRCVLAEDPYTHEKFNDSHRLVGSPFQYGDNPPTLQARTVQDGTYIPLKVLPDGREGDYRLWAWCFADVLFVRTQILPVTIPVVEWVETKNITTFRTGGDATRTTRWRGTAKPSGGGKALPAVAVVTACGGCVLPEPVILTADNRSITALDRIQNPIVSEWIELETEVRWSRQGRTIQIRSIVWDGGEHCPQTIREGENASLEVLGCARKIDGPIITQQTRPHPKLTFEIHRDDMQFVSNNGHEFVIRRGVIVGRKFNVIVKHNEHGLPDDEIRIAFQGGEDERVKGVTQASFLISIPGGNIGAGASFSAAIALLKRDVEIERHELIFKCGEDLSDENVDDEERPKIPVAIDVGTSKIVVAIRGWKDSIKHIEQQLVICRSESGEIETIRREVFEARAQPEAVLYPKLAFSRLPAGTHLLGKTTDSLMKEIVTSSTLIAERAWGIRAARLLLTCPPAYRLTSRLARWNAIVESATGLPFRGEERLRDEDAWKSYWVCPTIQEPVACFHAWLLTCDEATRLHRHWLVIDLGAGTTDIALLECDPDQFTRRDRSARHRFLGWSSAGWKDGADIFHSFGGSDADVTVSRLLALGAQASGLTAENKTMDDLTLRVEELGISRSVIEPLWFKEWRTAADASALVGYQDPLAVGLLTFCEVIKLALLSHQHDSLTIAIEVSSQSPGTKRVEVTLTRGQLCDALRPGVAMVAAEIAKILKDSGLLALESEGVQVPPMGVIIAGQAYWPEWDHLIRRLLADLEALNEFAATRLKPCHPYDRCSVSESLLRVLRWDDPGVTAIDVHRYQGNNATVVAMGALRYGHLARQHVVAQEPTFWVEAEKLWPPGREKWEGAALQGTGPGQVRFEVVPSLSSTPGDGCTLEWFVMHAVGLKRGSIWWNVGQKVVAVVEENGSTEVKCE